MSASEKTGKVSLVGNMVDKAVRYAQLFNAPKVVVDRVRDETEDRVLMEQDFTPIEKRILEYYHERAKQKR